jgi:hypothetical protein
VTESATQLHMSDGALFSLSSSDSMSGRTRFVHQVEMRRLFAVVGAQLHARSRLFQLAIFRFGPSRFQALPDDGIGGLHRPHSLFRQSTSQNKIACSLNSCFCSLEVVA